MASRVKSCLCGAMAVAWAGLLCAQPALQIPPAAAEDPTALPSLPYTAEVVGTDVLIRAGAGTTFYMTQKISEPARVTVVGRLWNWSKIAPPTGSFSWVAKEYVDLHPTVPGLGIVNRDGTRIWAGSPYVEPMRSYQQQVQLHQGDVVHLLDIQDIETMRSDQQAQPHKADWGRLLDLSTMTDYYKILPPDGAYVWISSRFLKPVAGPGPPLPPGCTAIAPADLDGDCIVGLSDLAIFAQQLLACGFADPAD